MSLGPGTRLGNYTISGSLGAGGMGEVYQARDGKLDRDVAIKILPVEVSLDADRVARFAREAKVLAALNHPNIAAIYGLEEGGTASDSALVMELVPGETLQERLARGALAVAEVQALLPQLIDALDAAHEQGIVHRDLKPGNIKVREDGTLKVLDFGLAKALETGSGIGDSGSGSMANSPTITSPAMTRAGVILGTAAYMSPEQARGKTVDKRSDIWAFGCVAFEMLTGHRAFGGETVTDTLAGIVTRDPDWTLLPPATPAAMVSVLKQCLEKDPRRRLRDIADARHALLQPAPAPLTATPSSARAAWRVTLPWAIALLSVLLAAYSRLAENRAGSAAPASLVRFTLPPPADALLDRTGTTRASGAFTISPNGQLVTFLATADGGRLWVRSLDALARPRRLAGTEGALQHSGRPTAVELASSRRTS